MEIENHIIKNIKYVNSPNFNDRPENTKIGIQKQLFLKADFLYLKINILVLNPLRQYLKGWNYSYSYPKISFQEI